MTVATSSPARAAPAPARSAAAARLMEAQARHPGVAQADRAVQTMVGVGAEMARFAAARLDAALAAQQEMLGCRTVSEMREVRSRYVRGAVNDYAAEWLRLVDLGLGLGLTVARDGAVPGPAPKRHATPV